MIAGKTVRRKGYGKYFFNFLPVYFSSSRLPGYVFIKKDYRVATKKLTR